MNSVRPSRDGDQFHYLWAARRCLRLLSAQGDLVAISIEGPSPAERADDPPASAGEEVIDVAEYFKSEDIREARLVRYIQLKHSTLHAAEPWKDSGLEKTIKGFAERYRKLVQTFSAETLATKLQFWFVTNRPISVAFAEAVSDAAAENQPRRENELRKLERFTGFNGGDLAAFSRLLHFMDRQDDYWDQRNILFQDVSGYLPSADVDAPIRLEELVIRKALSEGEADPTITKMDVLRALNTDEHLLLPANCLIETLDSAVPRDQEPNLLQQIASTQEPVIVHASAGVGKTVFATRIAEGLPDGSTCILYDCFGSGRYRSASGYRHRHKDALVQIANELAAKTLCHLLVPTFHADASDYVRAFIHRLDQAVTLLRRNNRNALLCIVIDAADNAQMAAKEIGEARSFVRDLIREKMPEGVRLVFLCRTHRLNDLDPPAEAVRLELRPFSRDETAACLRQKFPEANEQDIDEFHRLSSQNPRVQALALSRNQPLYDTLRLLGPNPTTVDDTISSLLESAIAKLKDSVSHLEKAQIDRICTGLAALRPLIPIPVLSAMSDVQEDSIRSFAIDIGRPLVVAGDTIQFFDEPAETWFRERFKPPADATDEFIASLRPLAATSVYVASILPQLMLEAGRFSELVELALTSEALPDTNPLKKRDVELQRLQFALKASLRQKRYLDAAKLALKAGGETAADNRQRGILQENIDLAATVLETVHIQELVSRRTFGSGWLGSHHAYEAALLSGRPELVGDARSRLRMAHEWLRNWSRLTPEERKKEVIQDQDIVELTFAHINIHGPADGARSLRGWQPREVSFRVGGTVTRRLIDHGRFEDVEAFARAAGNNLCLLLAITDELRMVQRTLPAEVTRRAFRLVANTRVELKDGHALGDRDSVIGAVVALVEAGLQHAVCTADEAVTVISRYLPSEPPRELSPRFTDARFPVLRAYCLRAALQDHVLELRDLVHAELRAEMDKKDQHPISHDLREFQKDIGALLPWHRLWADAFLGRVTQESLEQELKRMIEMSRNSLKFDYRDNDHILNGIALLWLDIHHKLDATDATDAAALTAFSDWKDGLKSPLYTSTLTALARLCGQDGTAKPIALEFAFEAFKLTKDERADAEEKSEGYINAARAILRISKQDAEAYFNEAVEVASKIGDENLSRWDAILYLADRSARIDNPSPEVAYNFARCAEVTYDYIARDKYFDWHATIRALCGLCPSSTLAILSRWRDRGFGWHEEILPVAVDRLIERGNVDPRDVLPLIGFRAQWTYDRLLENVLVKCVSLDEKNTVIAHLYRYMQFSGGNFSNLKEIASRHGISITGLDDVIAFEKTEKRNGGKPKNTKNRYSDEPNDAPPMPTRSWDDVFADCNLTNADGLSRACAALKSTEPPWTYDLFFKEAIRRVPVGSEAAFIEAVGNTPEFELYHYQEFLEQMPGAWKDRPATMRALAYTLKAFCRRYCMRIAKSRHYEILPFEIACTSAGMSEADMAGIVLDAVGETPDLADSSQLFSLVGLLAIKLSEGEAQEALKFGLDLYDSVLDDKHGDGPWSRQILPPSDIKASLAGYIWASMAAPECAMRWEGAHAVFGLFALKRQDVLGHLLKFATEKKGGPFVDSNLPFYGLHALQWLLIGTARAAIDFPTVLEPFANQIVDWALKDQPHVLIRKFAARAALVLVNNGILADRNNLKERLTYVNLSPFPLVESEAYDRTGPNRNERPMGDDDDRYYFGLDIGPYWYKPLGRVFALSQDEIESEASNIIRTEFGFTATARWVEDERSRRNLYEERSTRHSHGSYPRADTLHFYHAYHAMMIVAGKLLAGTPTYRDSKYGQDDEFADWLDLHDLSQKDGRWLWDRRDPTPLERPAWLDRQKDHGTRPVVSMDDFDEALCAESMLNVWGDWTVADAEYERLTCISSALVSRDKSHALLRALGTAKHIAIPNVMGYRGIDEAGFSLKGWIAVHADDSGLDSRDRWSGGINFPPPGPACDIVDLMGMAIDPDRRLWKNQKETVLMMSQVWGRYDDSERHESSNPDRGSRLQASFDFITEMLGKLDRDLIIEVQIDQRRRYRPYLSSTEYDKENIPAEARLYLLGADGQFRTL